MSLRAADLQSLADGIEFPVESSSGTKPWFLTTVASHDGVDSIRSGDIGNNSSSSVKIKVISGGRLSFWWKVSSYGDEYFLIFYLDGAEQAKISGEVDWEQRFIRIPAGVHEIEWSYAKGQFGPLRTDAAWLDQVEFHSDAEGLPKVDQSITLNQRTSTDPITFPIELYATASSFLPVSYSVVEGPAFMRGNILVPTGNGDIRVRASQPGNEVFSAAVPVEQTIPAAAAPPHPLAADTPGISMSIFQDGYRRIETMAFQPDGKIIIAGNFKEIGGIARTNIARLNRDGTLDLDWHPHIPNGEITGLLVHGDAVYVGGNFYEVNGYGQAGLSKIFLAGSGVLDRNWDIRPNGGVTKILEYKNQLIVGGGFQGISGISKSYLAKVSFEGRGSVDSLWAPAPNQSITEMVIHGTNLFFAGYFTEVGGAPVSYLAKASLEGRGDVDAKWKVNFASPPPFIRALASTEDGCFVAGLFALEGAASQPYGLYQFDNTDGHLLAARFQNIILTALAVSPTRLYTAVLYDPDPLKGPPYILRMDPATLEPEPGWHVPAARPFIVPNAASGSNVEIHELALRGEDLWASGGFSSLSGSTSSGIVLLPTFEGVPNVTGTTTAAGFKSSSGLQITPHPADQLETTHYRITGIQNGTLYKNDGVTPVANGSFITVAEGAAGLRFQPDGGFPGLTTFEVQAAGAAQDFAAQGVKALAQITVLAERMTQTVNYKPLSNTSYSDGFVDLLYFSSSGLPIELSISGPVTRNGDRLTFLGVGAVTVIADQPGNEIFAPAPRNEQTFLITKGVQQLTFDAVKDARFGMSVPLRASASSGLPVTFAVSSGPASIANGVVTFEETGTVVLRAIQNGTDLYEPTQSEQQIIVARALQAITFPPIAPKPFDGKPLLLDASASSGLPITYRVLGGPATVQGNILTATGPGSVRLEAFQEGNVSYEPAVAEQFILFQKNQQTVDFPAVVLPTFTTPTALTNARIELLATASSGLPVHFWIQSGDAQILRDGARYLLSVSKPGSVALNAQQLGSETYDPSPIVKQNLLFPKLAQTIDFKPLADTTLDIKSIPLQATAGSGLPVRFSVLSGPGIVRTNELIPNGAGLIKVIAEQSGDDFYVLVSATNSLTVLRGHQTITFDPPATAPVISNLRLDAGASSGLPVSFAVLSGPASLISSNLLRFQTTGTVMVAASQAGNGNFEAASNIVRTIEAVKAAQVITFAPLSDRPWNEGPLVLAANNSSGLPVTYEVVSGPASISGGLLQLKGAGKITVRGFHSGTELFAPGEGRLTFMTLPITQTITFAPVVDTRLSEGPIGLQATASSGLPIQLTIVSGPATVNSNQLIPSGAGTVRIRASQPGTPDYLAAVPVERTFTVLKGRQTIQFSPIGTAHVNVPIELSATASSGLPVQFGVVSGLATINANRLTPIGQGKVTVVAMQLGNQNYEPAATVEQNITVTKDSQTIEFNAPSEIFLSTGALKLVATSTAGLPVTFAIISGPAVLSGDSLSPLGVGTVTIRAFQSGNDAFDPAPIVERTVSILRGSPSLRIARDRSNLILKWDSFFSEYRLERSSTLGTTWASVNASSSTVDGVITVSLPLQGSVQFFRLARIGP